MEAVVEPDIRIGPFALWVHRRQSEATVDPWWIDEIECRVVVSSADTTAVLTGTIPSRNLHFFAEELAKLNETLSGSAGLDGFDMGVVVVVEPADATGHLRSQFRLWPGGAWNGELKAEFAFDQTYLPQLLREVRRVLARFPVMVEFAGDPVPAPPSR